MCGIAGAWSRTGAPVDPGLLETMCDRLSHRGPDARGTRALGPVGLAHTRLAILDLSEAGRQPMSDSDGDVWITYNGEIYNFQELRAKLEAKGYRFKSQTDTEVLLYLYREYGADFLGDLRGMFAFAIWDGGRRRWMLARDRVGKKPLYYYLSDQRLVFASELKAILADPSVPREVWPEGLCDFLSFGFVPDPKTIFRGIRKLPPGSFALIDENGERLVEYWDLQFRESNGHDEAHFREQLVAKLQDAVECRRISDVPLGAFLSGGIDSSAVVALMAQRQNGTRVVTSSIGFEEEEYNELHHARTVVDQYDTDHHEDVVRYDRFETILDTLLWHFEEPFCDESAIATYYLSKLARSHVTVALSGDGGDEGFAGYRKYEQMVQEESWRKRIPGGVLAGMMLPLLRGSAGRAFGPRAARLANFVESAAADRTESIYLANAHLRDHEAKRLFGGDFDTALAGYRSIQAIEPHAQRAEGLDFLAAVLYVDTRFLLPGDFLVKVDRMSMASSLEVRCPFLDHHLLEFAATVPSSLKLRDGEKKYILKKSLEPYLPDSILYRRKQGFEVPLVTWFASSLKPYIQRELIDDPGVLGVWFDPAYVRRLWEEFLAGRRGHKALLWNLLMFKLWHKRWIEGA